MKKFATALLVLASLFVLSMPAIATESSETPAPEGTIFTFWPLIDYRESPKEGFSNLNILGPLIKIQKIRDEQVVAVRPLWYNSSNEHQRSSATDYLYPLASTETTPEVSRFQVLKLITNNSFRKDENEEKEKDSMFFPFYISGTSKKYGPYTSLFPIYGDIYERFWRDEYHFFLFPLYGSTVKKGTTSRNYLYPFFNTIEGEKESGGHFWPLYGQSSKEGVYRKKFVLWPIYMYEQKGLDTKNPTEKLFLFPLYTSTDSPDVTTRGYLWPFFGYREDRKRKEIERDYLWPLWWTVRGEDRQADTFLPFYANDTKKSGSKSWYLWPLFRNVTITSDTFTSDRDTLLYFLYSDKLERWTKDGSERRRTALWPLFVYNRDPRGVKSFSFPAPVEPILDRDGIEKNWAPLWRIYQQKWTDTGESALSILWNLYWHESRKDALAYELFPLISYRGDTGLTDASVIKGLIRYRNEAGGKSLNLLWLPFGLSWGEKLAEKDAAVRKAGEGS